MQGEGVVHLHQFGHLVLLEADESLEVGCLFAGAAHAVHYVAFLLLSDEEDVEDFDLGRKGRKKALISGRNSDGDSHRRLTEEKLSELHAPQPSQKRQN